MNMRVIPVGLSVPRRGRPRSIGEVEVSFNKTTFAEIRNAARQTHLPVASYVQEVVEADLAARRLASPPLPGVKT